MNSITYDKFRETLGSQGAGNEVGECQGYYFLKKRGSSIVGERFEKQRNAQALWKMARLSMHIIKRFPFVRGVFVSGDLSKNAAGPASDVDFFIITAAGRLWITRALLTLFKKTFLLNSKKYFCLNYFATEDHLSLDQQNIFLATEIAHLKPLFNSLLFDQYLSHNRWIQGFFPNFDITRLSMPTTNNRRSWVQQLLELPFRILPCDRLDEYILQKMTLLWKKRYPDFDDETREKIFRSTRHESRAYVGNYQQKILYLYHQKLREYCIVE